MRCPSCNKFVSFDTDVEPEVDVDISESQITGTVRIVNNCAECGDELKEATFDVDESVDGVDEHECDGTLSVEAEAERTDRLNDKTSTGKQIKHVRYMKMMYGAQATFKVSCDKCEFEAEISWADEIQGSAMEELV